ncbi:SDR family oxidoreductase [Herbiconiux sp. KACC 21604]|uniref:SDR family oxidoreductase n=1 Tax=unclassified Herbiconiux TaxID=2618217 RepID=UPI0014925943|nr:SDR family oxidoreductase [Herbiconiux sp. SALV-R1]QJU55294.1 SDR family oxidoreductase [Herbiconiux sp. SALV-R1]WPO86461.1 SDR family oxidoreductase [Herbiconiux sp. KACC 21604]
MKPTLHGRTALVTGANGGLGREFVRQALDRGAARVYATARNPREWEDDRVVPLVLDVADAPAARIAAESAGDVDLVINNAGVALAEDVSLLRGSDDALRVTMETNFFGALRVAQAFAPVLARNGGGAVINVLSAASWISVPTAYAASKAALWSATNSLRIELEEQGTHVVGVHLFLAETPMTRGLDLPMIEAGSVVSQTYDALAEGAWEVITDDTTRRLKAQLGGDLREMYATPFLPEATGRASERA